jgi:serine/threonine protein kinase
MLINDSYLKLEKLNGGAYGKIYLCRLIKPYKKVKTFSFDSDENNQKDNLIVLKKFRSIKCRTGFEVDLIREIKFLMHFSHRNIIRANNLFIKSPKTDKPEKFMSIYLEMDFMIPLSDVIANLDHKMGEEDFKQILH